MSCIFKGRFNGCYAQRVDNERTVGFSSQDLQYIAINARMLAHSSFCVGKDASRCLVTFGHCFSLFYSLARHIAKSFTTLTFSLNKSMCRSTYQKFS